MIIFTILKALKLNNKEKNLVFFRLIEVRALMQFSVLFLVDTSINRKILLIS